MVQWNLKGYVAGSILIQTDRGEGGQFEMKKGCASGGNGQMKLRAASRHFVGGMGMTISECNTYGELCL